MKNIIHRSQVKLKLRPLYAFSSMLEAKFVLITNRKSYELSIGTKLGDLG